MGRIQQDTQAAAVAMGEIRQIIAMINNYQATIASAVEEQTATSQEINHNISQAAVGTSGIADSINLVAGAAGQTHSGAEATRQAAVGVTEAADSLQSMIKHFTY